MDGQHLIKKNDVSKKLNVHFKRLNVLNMSKFF